MSIICSTQPLLKANYNIKIDVNDIFLIVTVLCMSWKLSAGMIITFSRPDANSFRPSLIDNNVFPPFELWILSQETLRAVFLCLIACPWKRRVSWEFACRTNFLDAVVLFLLLFTGKCPSCLKTEVFFIRLWCDESTSLLNCDLYWPHYRYPEKKVNKYGGFVE